MKVRVISGNVKYGGVHYAEGQTFSMNDEDFQEKHKSVLKPLVSKKKAEQEEE